MFLCRSSFGSFLLSRSCSSLLEGQSMCMENSERRILGHCRIQKLWWMWMWSGFVRICCNLSCTCCHSNLFVLQLGAIQFLFLISINLKNKGFSSRNYRENQVCTNLSYLFLLSILFLCLLFWRNTTMYARLYLYHFIKLNRIHFLLFLLLQVSFQIQISTQRLMCCLSHSLVYNMAMVHSKAFLP